MEDEQKQEPPVHEVMVDREVIYRGPDWAAVFLEAARNPENGFIVHTVNGEPQACWWPVSGRTNYPYDS
jgi:hypothetical protein